MTHKNNYTLIEDLSKQGLDAIPELVRILINNAMCLQREEHLKASPYERTPQRQGYANGYKPKTVKTKMGEITFDIPQVRDSNFYPTALEKGMRSERALTIALAEMYIQGVSTRKVKKITEMLCGYEVSASQVSRASAQLDEVLQKWRERELGEVRYLYLDARYEKVRENGMVLDLAVLIATGIRLTGEREVLGVSTSLSEHEQHWKAFLTSLKKRGLKGVKLIISDDHTGLSAARREVFGGIPWQRCQFHLQQNAGAYVPKKAMKKEVAADIRAIFNASDREKAEEYLQWAIEKYAQSAPKLSQWMEENLAEGLTVLNFPLEHRRMIRTTNALERINREIRRRTRVASIFPNEASCLRLVTALLMEISEEWLAGKRYCIDDNIEN